MNLNEYLPVTVVAAISIFLIKEVLEYRRKKLEKRRKLSAFKRVIARECERIGWVLAIFKNLLEVLSDSEVGHEKKTYSTRRGIGSSAELVVNIQSQESGNRSDIYPIYAVDRSLLNKLLIDIAALDEELYFFTEKAHDALGRVGNFQEMMIEGKGLHINWTELERLQVIASQSESSIDVAESEIFNLFKHCTGKETMDIRRY